MKEKVLLFSYGTLKLESVQLETYGRLLVGKADRLFNYKLEQLEITNPDVVAKSNQALHPIAVNSPNNSAFIEGMIYEISQEELEQTDKYEVADYKRVLEKFESGVEAWVYIKK